MAASRTKPAARKSKTGKATSNTNKVCNACGFQNAKSATSCKVCRKKKFAPNWVIAKSPINRQVSVEITKSNPEFGDEQERITLSKWWLGGRSSYHITSFALWEQLKAAVEELGGKIGWKTSKELGETISKNVQSGRKATAGLKKALSNSPETVSQLLDVVDWSKFKNADISELAELVNRIAESCSEASAGFREAFLSVLGKLPKQKQRALEELDGLLETWSLQVVTNVAQQVRTRLQTIELFEQQVNDPLTFEIIGDNSIHRILEHAMWLVDERYWILHSNKTLRTSIGNELSKSDKKRYGKSRPDFVCGTFGDRLVILELKRPDHTLNVDDLNQLETYVTIAESYLKYRSYEAYLVGTKCDGELERRIKHRSSNFKILTYTELMNETKERYHEFLKSIDT